MEYCTNMSLLQFTSHMIINSYLNFIFREPSKNPASIGEARQDLIHLAILSCFFFGAICKFSHNILIYLPSYGKIPVEKKKEIPVYISSLVHHLVVVPLCSYRIYVDLTLPSEEMEFRNYSYTESGVIPLCFGYLFADTIFYALGEAKSGKFDTLLHHILGLALFYLVYNSPGCINRFVPHIVVCEASALFFNLAWLLRNALDLRGSRLVQVCEYLFVVLFFFTRVINLPIVVWRCLQLAPGNLLNLGRLLFYPIVGLQYFWFYKILSSLLSRRTDKSK